MYTLGSHGWKHKIIEEHGPRKGGLTGNGKDEVALAWLEMMDSSGAWPPSRVRTGSLLDGEEKGWDGWGQLREHRPNVAANVDKYPQFRKTLGLVQHGAG